MSPTTSIYGKYTVSTSAEAKLIWITGTLLFGATERLAHPRRDRRRRNQLARVPGQRLHHVDQTSTSWNRSCARPPPQGPSRTTLLPSCHGSELKACRM